MSKSFCERVGGFFGADFLRFFIAEESCLRFFAPEKAKIAIDLCGEKGALCCLVRDNAFTSSTFESVEWLLGHGQNPNVLDFVGNPAWHYVIERMYLDSENALKMFDIFFKSPKGIDYFLRNDNEDTLLHTAVKGCHVDLAHYLLGKEQSIKWVPIGIKDGMDKTLLASAVDRLRTCDIDKVLEIARLLVRADHGQQSHIPVDYKSIFESLKEEMEKFNEYGKCAEAKKICNFIEEFRKDIAPDCDQYLDCSAGSE